MTPCSVSYGVFPWDAPIWNAGGDGNQFVPGFVRRHVGFWHDIILKDHTLRDTLVLYACDGADLHDLVLREYRGPSSAGPFDVARFPGTVFHNRFPSRFTSFVDDEVRALGFRLPYQRATATYCRAGKGSHHIVARINFAVSGVFKRSPRLTVPRYLVFSS